MKSERKIYTFAETQVDLGYTGERFTSSIDGEIEFEHRHRYLFALQYCEGQRVLDIASGEGYGSALISTVAAHVVGVDIDAGAIDHALSNYGKPNLEYRLGSATKIPVPDGSIDTVVSFETIEHFAEHDEFIAEIRRVLRPGGVVVMSSPNKGVYTQEGDPTNHYHVRELTRFEFLDLLSKSFGHVSAYEQSVFTGSLIVPEKGAADKSFVSYQKVDAQSYARGTGLPAAVYMIAVASDQPISRAEWGNLNDPHYLARLSNIIQYNEHLIRERTREVEDLAAAQSTLIGDLHGLNVEVRALKGELQQREVSFAALTSSTSWRVTAPLRRARAGFDRFAAHMAHFSRLANVARTSLVADGPLETVRKIASAPRRHGLGELLGLKAPPRQHARLPSLYLAPVKMSAQDLLSQRVLIIAELSLPQCAKYRVWQKQQHFEALGVPCTVISWGEKDRVRQALQTHTLAIFYRVPGYADILDLISEAKRLSVPTAWEVDDLIFDSELYAANRNVDLLSAELRHSVLSGVPLYRAALQACDYAIASTASLAEAMRSVGVKDAFVVENSLDQETLDIAAKVRRARQGRDPGHVTIIYGSGSKAHDADFECAADGVASVLLDRPHARLRIVGDLTLPASLDSFADRIERVPFTDYPGYLSLLGEADISLAPLEPSIFNDAKSNIKFLEAAILGLPSVCSPRAAFRDLIDHDLNGILADSASEWSAGILRLIDDPALRARLGSAALEAVITRYSPEAIAETQVRPIAERFASPALSNLRILAANVFFNPQSFGGATIVAEQTALRLNSRPDTEVVVFTSSADSEAVAYDLLRYETAGMPVVAVRLPDSHRPKLEYDNPRMGETFAQLLQAVRPDVVHFHSIQVLSASLAAACKKAGVPYVITLHDAWWICERQFMVRDDGRYCFQTKIDLNVCSTCVPDIDFTKLRTARLRKVLDEAALLLAPSEFHRELHIANGIAPDRIIVNRNGIRLPHQPVQRTGAGPLRFGFVGGAGPIKGIDLVRRAFEEIDAGGYELVVVDNTMNIGFSSIDTRGWKLNGSVKRVPAYNQDSIDEFFGTIDVLLFPSQWKESFGLTVREALARDVWVILTESGGAVEDIVDGENGSIIPIGEDHRPLKQAIEALLADRERLKGYKNAHKSRIVSFDDQVTELHALLAAVAKAHGARKAGSPETKTSGDAYDQARRAS